MTKPLALHNCSVASQTVSYTHLKQHTQASHIAGHPHSLDGTYRIYRTLELTEIQEAIIEVAHGSCKWVVCVDQAIDRHILENSNSKIIGFTTGEGRYCLLYTSNPCCVRVSVKSLKSLHTRSKRPVREFSKHSLILFLCSSNNSTPRNF